MYIYEQIGDKIVKISDMEPAHILKETKTPDGYDENTRKYAVTLTWDT